jgi:hypothetical protein
MHIYVPTPESIRWQPIGLLLHLDFSSWQNGSDHRGSPWIIQDSRAGSGKCMLIVFYVLSTVRVDQAVVGILFAGVDSIGTSICLSYSSHQHASSSAIAVRVSYLPRHCHILITSFAGYTLVAASHNGRTSRAPLAGGMTYTVFVSNSKRNHYLGFFELELHITAL